MTPTCRRPFRSPMQSLRRAAWLVAAKGNPIAWSDPGVGEGGR